MMTYKEQFTWLTRNGFSDIEICSGNSILWRKEYKNFNLDLYWSQHLKKHWSLIIRNKDNGLNEEIDIAELLDNFDFSTMDSIILFFDSHSA